MTRPLHAVLDSILRNLEMARDAAMMRADYAIGYDPPMAIPCPASRAFQQAIDLIRTESASLPAEGGWNDPSPLVHGVPSAKDGHGFSEQVLAHVVNRGLIILQYRHDHQEWMDYGGMRWKNVTHWMPLPAPPTAPIAAGKGEG